MNNKIHPVLYDFYLIIHQTLGAQIVHRRKRHSPMCIEIIFDTPIPIIPTGRLNSLREAEACGFWVICRQQTKGKHAFYKGHQVYQLFLSPVHPKKRRAIKPVIIPLTNVYSEAMYG